VAVDMGMIPLKVPLLSVLFTVAKSTGLLKLPLELESCSLYVLLLSKVPTELKLILILPPWQKDRLAGELAVREYSESTAASALIKPFPVAKSNPGVPISIHELIRAVLISFGVAVGFACSINAATAAACGAAAEVPKKLG